MKRAEQRRALVRLAVGHALLSSISIVARRLRDVGAGGEPLLQERRLRHPSHALHHARDDVFAAPGLVGRVVRAPAAPAERGRAAPVAGALPPSPRGLARRGRALRRRPQGHRVEPDRRAPLRVQQGRGDRPSRSRPSPRKSGDELRELMRKVDAGDPIAAVETLRRDARGELLDVQLSVLPFREGAGPEQLPRGHRGHPRARAAPADAPGGREAHEHREDGGGDRSPPQHAARRHAAARPDDEGARASASPRPPTSSASRAASTSASSSCAGSSSSAAARRPRNSPRTSPTSSSRS